jgi:hypothetical protein
MAYENEWDRWSPRRDLAWNGANRRDFMNNYAQPVDSDSLSTWATNSEKLDNDYNMTGSRRIRGRGGNHLPPSATSVVVVTPVVPASGDPHHYRRPSNTRWRGEERSEALNRNSVEDFYVERAQDRDRRRPSSRNVNRRQTPSPHAIPLVPRTQSSSMDDHRRRQASVRKDEYRRNYFYEDDRNSGYREDFEGSYDSWSRSNNRDDHPPSMDSRSPRDEDDDKRYYNKSLRRGSSDSIRDGGHWMKGGRMQPRQQPEYSSRRGDFSVISDIQDSQADWQPTGSTQSDHSSRGGWLDRRRGQGGGGLRVASTIDSPSETSSTRGSFKVKRARYFGSASLSSSGVRSAKSRTTLSTRGTGGTDALSVLTDDRTAERAAAALVEDLRSKGFQLRGDGTIHSTGSSTFSKMKYPNGERYVASMLDDLESHREELRGSHSVDEGERYSTRPSNEGKATAGFSVISDIGSSTQHDSTTLTSATEEKETIERPGLRAMPSLMVNSLFDAQSSTEGTKLENSTISTKDSMFGKMKVLLSMGDSTTKDGGGGGGSSSGDRDKGESTNESSTLASSTVEDGGGGGGGNSVAETGKVTWGGEMPPLTASGARVPETVTKDHLFGLNHNISDLSSGPNVSVKPIHQEPESIIDRFIDHFLVGLRLTVAQPCRSS